MPDCEGWRRVRPIGNGWRRYGWLLACLLSLLLGACGQGNVQLPTLPKEEVAARVSGEDYLIGSEDVLEVLVWKNPDLSREVKVRPDGKISLPLVGDLQAAGETVPQLTVAITEQLQRYYKDVPQVSVIVQQVNSYAVYLLGEIRNPGRYVVKTGTTFLQALTLAHGFTEFANTRQIILRRRLESGQTTALTMRYSDVVTGRQVDPVLKSGDIIIFP